MSTLGFEDYVEPLKVYLHKYRELEGEKASTAKQGDQSGGKEVNQGGMPSMNVGMQSAMNGGMNSMSGGPINGGMHPAAMPMMQQQYGQQQQPPPGMMYAPTHQMMSQYQQMPMQNGPGQPRGIQRKNATEAENKKIANHKRFLPIFLHLPEKISNSTGPL